MLSFRDPARFFPCSDVSINECSDYARCTITFGSETFPENINTDEVSREMTFRKLMIDVVISEWADEHINASERKDEVIYRLIDPETKRASEVERVIAVMKSL